MKVLSCCILSNCVESSGWRDSESEQTILRNTWVSSDTDVSTSSYEGWIGHRPGRRWHMLCSLPVWLYCSGLPSWYLCMDRQEAVRGRGTTIAGTTKEFYTTFWHPQTKGGGDPPLAGVSVFFLWKKCLIVSGPFFSVFGFCWLHFVWSSWFWIFVVWFSVFCLFCLIVSGS